MVDGRRTHPVVPYGTLWPSGRGMATSNKPESGASAGLLEWGQCVFGAWGFCIGQEASNLLTRNGRSCWRRMCEVNGQLVVEMRKHEEAESPPLIGPPTHHSYVYSETSRRHKVCNRQVRQNEFKRRLSLMSICKSMVDLTPIMSRESVRQWKSES